MTHASMELCGLCHTPIEARHPAYGSKTMPKDGLEVVVGYSIGGWGHRGDAIRFSDEVCRECFDTVIAAAALLGQAMDRCLAKRAEAEGVPGGLRYAASYRPPGSHDIRRLKG